MAPLIPPSLRSKRKQHPRPRCRCEPSDCVLLSLFLCLLLIPDACSWSVKPLLLRRPIMRWLNNKDSSNHANTNLLQATAQDKSTSSDATTWSRSPGESRLGVRRRVRRVLEKARNRTGIPNQGQVVADAASMGMDEADLVFSSNANANLYDSMFQSSSSNGTESLVLESSVLEETTNGFDEKVPVDSLLNGQTVGWKNGADEVNTTPSPTSTTDEEAVALNGDSSKKEKAVVVEPLPFTLPTLSSEQKQRLLSNERIQEQSKMGREGSGYVVLDVKAPDHVVWDCLLDFEAYPETIGTVRSMQMFTNTHLENSYRNESPVLDDKTKQSQCRHYGSPSVTRAAFVLSKFRFRIAAIHRYQPHPSGHYMEFTLDKACTNAVLKEAKGIWYTQPNPDGRGEEYTRVWLLCGLKVSSMLPTFVVDYTAKRAMPRASTWLAPTVEKRLQELQQQRQQKK